MALDDKTKQDMESGLEHAVRVVQTRFAEFEHKIFVPCLESSRRFSQGRPITSTLISVFILLSFLPIVSFIGFTILVTAAFLFIGLGGALIASTLLVVAAGSVLIFIFGALLLTSTFITGVLVTLFVGIRLVQHLRLQLGASRSGSRKEVPKAGSKEGIKEESTNKVSDQGLVGAAKQAFVDWARETRDRMRWRLDDTPTAAGEKKAPVVVADEDDGGAGGKMKLKRELSVPSVSEEWHPISISSGKDASGETG